MRIDAIETIRTPIQPNLCLVRLRADDGSIGLGETFWGAAAVEAHIHDTLAPQMLAMESVSPETLREVGRPYVGFSGSGAEMRALSACDIALWDLTARRAGLSVAELAGGPVRDQIRVYNTCAGYDYIRAENRQSSSNWGIGTESGPYDDLNAFLTRPEELVDSLLGEGYTAMKVWPFDRAAEQSYGRDLSLTGLREGMSIMERLRDAAGDRMDLLVELHGQWSVKPATQILRALADIDPYFVEDPLRTDALDGYRMLRDRTEVPIAAGETLTGRRAHAALLDTDALDVTIIDAGWTGGLTEALAISAIAESRETPFAPHDCTGPVSFAATVHLAAARSNCLIGESVRAFHDDWYPQIAQGVPAVVDGAVRIPTTAGLGVRLRDDFLARDDTNLRASVRP
ncbi:MAG: mandelate racemase/muconate lactonizing enzyme family protein [Beutenbergiaceae bacterium]